MSDGQIAQPLETDRLLHQPVGREHLVASFAVPIPALVICELPAHAAATGDLSSRQPSPTRAELFDDPPAGSPFNLAAAHAYLDKARRTVAGGRRSNGRG
ncbi:hypothetical protein AB0F17_32890 [Nonomuraea sp. NPDC026600]|uniref:hypothetical protein n=1 Tax=Nonomuraea sp. NPDC026600 TaxID=3155363 RepID=UPI00340F07DC